MERGKTLPALALTCCIGLTSVGCLNKKTEAVAVEEAAPPPAAYPQSSGYADTTSAPGASAPAASAPAPEPREPEPFELRSDEKLVDYVVQSGDSLTKIAQKHKSSISRIQSANGMTGTTIYAGKTIQVPVPKASGNLAMNSSSPARTSPTPTSPAPAPATQPAPTTPPIPAGASSTSYPRVSSPPTPPSPPIPPAEQAFPTPNLGY